VDKYGLSLDSIGVTSMGHLIIVEQHTNNRAPTNSNKRCFFDGRACLCSDFFVLVSSRGNLCLLDSRRPCLPIYPATIYQPIAQLIWHVAANRDLLMLASGRPLLLMI
jgi:hypothetical protein